MCVHTHTHACMQAHTHTQDIFHCLTFIKTCQLRILLYYHHLVNKHREPNLLRPKDWATLLHIGLMVNNYEIVSSFWCIQQIRLHISFNWWQKQSQIRKYHVQIINKTIKMSNTYQFKNTPLSRTFGLHCIFSGRQAPVFWRNILPTSSMALLNNLKTVTTSAIFFICSLLISYQNHDCIIQHKCIFQPELQGF